MPAVLVSPLPLKDRAPVTLLLHPAGKGAGWRGERMPRLVAALLGKGQQVLAVDLFGTGEAGAHQEADAGKIHHYFTYNRTPAANQVQDILTALAFARERRGAPVNLLALKGTGVAALLARALAPEVGNACLSLAAFSFDDRSWLRHCFVPGVRSAGDVRAAVALTAPGRLFLHGAGPGFPAAWARQVYRSASRPRSLRLSPRPCPGGRDGPVDRGGSPALIGACPGLQDRDGTAFGAASRSTNPAWDFSFHHEARGARLRGSR